MSAINLRAATSTALRFTLLALGLALALLSLGCGPQVLAVTAPDASFAAYRTIAYAGEQSPPEGFTRATLAPEARKAALEAARDALLAKGWKAAPAEEADVIVFAGVGRRKDVQRTTSVTGQDTEVVVDKGAIVIDAFDRKTNQNLWTGQVEGTIKPPIDDLEKLGKAVTKLMNEFPAPGSG